jgi:hypothetical protein
MKRPVGISSVLLSRLLVSNDATGGQVPPTVALAQRDNKLIDAARFGRLRVRRCVQ